MANCETDDYAYLLANEIPIIDVRAPAEFNQGASPTAVNLPILDDSERQEVGIEYKKRGQNAAIARGRELVRGSNRSQKIDSWNQFAAKYPNAVVCCWRGGLRSRIAQQWLAGEGLELYRVSGGSKALRQYCLSVLESSRSRKFVVLAGQTGSGKTKLIQELSPSIDLEKLANHRGSAFGRVSSPQPRPIAFEFALAIQLLRRKLDRPLLVEDESSMIGVLKIPEPFYSAMSSAPLVLLSVPLEQRVALTYESYVANSTKEMLEASLNRIRKRLGGLRFQQIHKAMTNAFCTCEREDHFRWIEMLLKYYYDPMYEYQLNKKQDRVEFQGSVADVRTYLESSMGDKSTTGID